MDDLARIAQAKAAHQAALLAKPNVVGVGTGYRTVGKQTTDQLCLVTLVRRKIRERGWMRRRWCRRKWAACRRTSSKWGICASTRRAIFAGARAGGVSIGHFQVTAGTLGCLVRDRRSGVRLILSNNMCWPTAIRRSQETPCFSRARSMAARR